MVEFVTKLMPISNRFLSFIIPSRWVNGGIGLDDFRENIIHNKSVKYIKDFKLSDNVFKGVIISGGVMYFLMDKFYSGKCIVEYDNNDICTVSNRYLDEYEIYIRDNQSVKIIDKIKAKKYVDTIMSNLNPFGIDSDVRGYKEPNQIKKYKLLSSGGYGFISKFEVSKGCEYMPFYKTVVAKALSSKEGKILGTVEVTAPNEFCTFSYFIAGCFTSKEEANNLRTYLKSKFTRFMIFITTASINTTKKNYKFVPVQDFTPNSDIDWSQSISDIDQQLYKKYGLTQEEIDYIESTIKPMN